MTTASNSSATLLLVTGLLSVSMAAMGYYYLHMSSKKLSADDGDDGEAAGVHNGQKAPAACPFSRGLTEEEKRSGAKCPVTGMLASFTGGGKDATASETTEKTTSIEAPSPKKMAKTPEQEVQTTFESPDKKVEGPVVIEEVAASPKKTPNSSPKKTGNDSLKKTVESPKKEVEPPVLELPKPAHSSPKKAPESPKKESEPVAIKLPEQAVASSEETPESPKKAPESSKKTPGSPKKVVESPKKTPESPKKVVQSLKQIVDNPETIAKPAPDAVAMKLSEDFVFTQAVSETATAFTEELLQESLENVALDQEEYVQVELTQSMTLSQSTPELIDVEDAAVKNEEEDIAPSAATENEESIVEEEQDQVAADSVASASAEPVDEAAAALASPKSPRVPSASWEAITSSPVVKAAIPTEEPALPLSLDTPAESAEAAEPLSINVPAENSEAPAEDKDTASSPVSSGGSSSGRRNRNRSKKSKSKKKKGKKKIKA